MLTKENYTKVKALRERIQRHLDRIKEMDAEIKAWEELKQKKLSLISIDLAQLGEISNEEIPEND
jgi:heme oxygenase